jgi:hypothetical protein
VFLFFVLRLRYVIATPNLISGDAPLRMTNRVFGPDIFKEPV